LAQSWRAGPGIVIATLVKILVDVEEQRSAVPSCLQALGVEVELTRLPVGDYLVATDVAVERKTVRDLHQSLVSGSLWSQVFALRRDTKRPYVVVEGAGLDAGRISPRGVRGALLRIVESGVPVLRSSSPSDTALWLQLLARREQARAEGLTLRRRGRRRMVVSPVGVLATVPGISPKTANRLLAHFGSIARIAAASQSDLQRVEGVGPRRASDLHRVLSRHPH
jgi:ERCC4-type nuclease